MVDLETAIYCGGNCAEIAVVRADHQVASADGALDHAHVDDVSPSCAGGQRAHGAGLFIVERLDVTSGQEPRQERLTAGSAPRLGEHRGGNGRDLAAHKQGAMPGPDAALSPVGGDQRAGIEVTPITHSAAGR